MSLIRECDNYINNDTNNTSKTNNNKNKIHTKTNLDKIQEKYLRDATLFFRGIEKPLKYGPTVDTLQDLINGLHNAFETNYVNIELVNHLMLSYKSNIKEWQKFAKWDRYRYTRNLVDEGNSRFNLMILCWGEGHSSAIHDHSNSHCFMKIMQGKLIETRYELPSSLLETTNPTTTTSNSSATTVVENNTGISIIKCNNNNNVDDDDNYNKNKNNNGNDTDNYDDIELKEISQDTLELNAVCYINDNIGLHRVENPSHTDGAVSLHLYCPPFNSCSIFQKNSGKRIQCPVTFWSKYGIRQDKKDAEVKSNC